GRFTGIGLGSCDFSAEKKRDSRRNPPVSYSVVSLERELQRELELTHAASRTRRRILLNVGDLASIAAAVDTEVPLIGVEAQHRMIEHVEGIHAELCFHPLGDGKVLHERRIRPKTTRADKTVHAIVAQIAESRIGERAACGSRNVGYRREELDVGACAWRMVERSRSSLVGAGFFVGTANG